MELPAIFSTLELSPAITTLPPDFNPLDTVKHLAALMDTAKANYRRLSMEYHPDRGGDIEAMKRLNEAYEQVQKLRIAPRQMPVVSIVIDASGMSVHTATSTATSGWSF